MTYVGNVNMSIHYRQFEYGIWPVRAYQVEWRPLLGD